MIHPQTRVELVSADIGVGVLATAKIPRGTIVWTQDCFDRILAPTDVDALDEAHRAVVDHYAYLDARGNRILCWDAGRLVNHSCAPAIRGVGSWFMVAAVDLEPGDEITCDYAECNIDPALECRCGGEHCRGRVHARDLLRFADRWDAEVSELVPDVRRVPQPLWPYLLRPEEARDMLEGRRPIPSFREQCAFREDLG